MSKINLTICIATIAVLLNACGDNRRFTISGSVDDPALNGEKLYLLDLYGDSEAPVDSCVVTDGHYTLQGQVAEPWLAALQGATTSYTAACVVEPGTIVIGDDSLGGTPLNEQLFRFNRAISLDSLTEEMEQCMAVYYTAGDANERAAAERKLDSLQTLGTEQVLAESWNLYNANHDNVLALHAMQAIVGMGEFEYAEFDSIVKAATPMVANHPSVQEKLSQLRAIEATSVGKHYTDIQGVDGRLSDLIDGRVALVDYYASWCGPCRFEIRDNLVPLWKKYQDKGLVIVGLNVWERGDRAAREAAHRKVMDELGITYPQLVDSTRTATDTYGVLGIPQIMLIGRDGTILARDLRGDAIEEAVVKALGK